MNLESKVDINGSEVSKIVEKALQNCDTRHKEQLTVHVQKYNSFLAQENSDI